MSPLKKILPVFSLFVLLTTNIFLCGESWAARKPGRHEDKFGKKKAFEVLPIMRGSTGRLSYFPGGLGKRPVGEDNITLVFVPDGGGTISAINAENGEKVWNMNVQNTLYCTPSVHNGHFYVGSHNNKLYSLNALTGKEEWSVNTNGGIFSTPVYHDGAIYIACYDNHIYKFEAETGKKIWSYNTQSTLEGGVCVHDNMVFFSPNGREFCSLNAEDGKVKYTVKNLMPCACSPLVVDEKLLVTDRNSVLHCLNPENGEHIWKAEKISAPYNTPAVQDSKVFIIDVSTGGLTCLDLEKGDLLWTKNFGNGNGLNYVSPLAFEKSVYALAQNGTVFSYDQESGDLNWKLELNEGFQSSPALKGETLYVSTQGNNLYAINAKTGEKIWKAENAGRCTYSSPVIADYE